MKNEKSFKFSVLAIFLMFGLLACDKPGPAETAGKKIDQSVENAGQSISHAAENAGDKVEQTFENAGEKIDQMANKASNKLDEQSRKTDVVIEDTEITAKVKAAIFAEPGLSTLQISVDTVKGIVTLTGSVDLDVNKARAGGLAGAVSGVKAVDNRLVLKST